MNGYDDRMSAMTPFAGGRPSSDSGETVTLQMKNGSPRGSDVSDEWNRDVGNSSDSFNRAASSAQLFQAIQSHQTTCKWWHNSLGRFKTFWMDPRAPERVWWDFLMLCLVLYSAFFEPYAVAFLGEQDTSTSKMQWAERIVDYVFYIDLGIQFLTAYDNGYELVTRKNKIASRYLHGWFFPDLISTLNWQFFIQAFNGTKKKNRRLRMLRLIKMLRLVRASRLISQLTETWHVSTRLIEAALFFVYVWLCAHTMSCLFFLLPTIMTCAREEVPANFSRFDPDQHCIEGSFGCAGQSCIPGSWRQDYVASSYGFPWGTSGIDWVLEDSQNGQVHPYIQSMYWALTTMTTIGYGDVTPNLQSEFIFVLLAEFIGLAAFALLLMHVTGTYKMMGHLNAEKDDARNKIVAFMSANSLDQELIGRVIAYINFKRASPSARMFNPEREIFSHLTQSLRKELGLALGLPIMLQVPIFGREHSKDPEMKKLKQLFNKADVNKNGDLSVEEFAGLMHDLKLGEYNALTLPAFQADQAEEGNLQGVDDPISLDSFEEWYLHKKYKRPVFTKAPLRFLHKLVEQMEMVSYSGGDVVVERGEYGEKLFIVLNGELNVDRPPPDNDEGADVILGRDGMWHCLRKHKPLVLAELKPEIQPGYGPPQISELQGTCGFVNENNQRMVCESCRRFQRVPKAPGDQTPCPRENDERFHFDDEITKLDDIPLFGLAAALPEAERRHIVRGTKLWRAWLPKADAQLLMPGETEAHFLKEYQETQSNAEDGIKLPRTYCDMVEIHYKDLAHAFAEQWEDGPDEMKKICLSYNLYNYTACTTKGARARGHHASFYPTRQARADCFQFSLGEVRHGSAPLPSRTRHRGFGVPLSMPEHLEILDSKMALLEANMVAVHEKLDAFLIKKR